MTQQFSFLEFFAGGGMARLGLGDSWRCLLANDFDPQKCAAYRANFGDDDLVEADIAALGLSDLPGERADLIWGSFPCQDLSLAGARGGIHAKRSGAFFSFQRLVEDLHTSGRAPHIVAIENVAGLMTSNGGRDFAVVVESLAALDYRVTAMVLDARTFTPQSRPRLFILGFGPAAAPAIAEAPASEQLAPPALMAALDHVSPQARAQWLWLTPTAPPHRNTRLADIIDWDAADWHAPAQTKALIDMMSTSQRARIDAIKRNGARRAGAGFRRTRVENGKSVQRFEARFDGLAGCLRTPAGGSSRQIVVAIEAGKARTRLISPREAARLMGLREDYILPDSTTAALKLCGDGVCAPLVQWLGETIFAPTLPRRARKTRTAA
jgi:DNA (cytosine-5)-methyltransferase 1